MNMVIIQAMVAFQKVLVEKWGKPVDLEILYAFSHMMGEIINELQRKED